MRIGILTSGGDAPGLNAVIRSVTTTATRRGHEIVGLVGGFDGLLTGRTPRPLAPPDVVGIEREGGTILGAANQGSALARRGPEAIAEALAGHAIEALIVAGGDGTMGIAHRVATLGVQVVGLPKTIDRDLAGTHQTFGFDSAAAFATQALDRLHATAASHERLMVVEVMGRDVGWIALYAGIAGGAHMIALPELPFRLDRYVRHVRRRERDGARYHLMVAAEGAYPEGGEPVRSARTGNYGGIGERLAARLGAETGKQARALQLGHLLRGGRPTTHDRVLGMRLGAVAVSAIDRGETDVMVAYRPPKVTTVPLADVVGRLRRVEPTTHELATARNLGIELGA